MRLSATESHELTSEAEEIAAVVRLLRREKARSRAIAKRGRGHDITYQTCRSFAVGLMPVWLQGLPDVLRLPDGATQSSAHANVRAWLQGQKHLRDPGRSFSIVISPDVFRVHIDDEERLPWFAVGLLILGRQPNVTIRVLDLARPLKTAFYSGFTIYDEELVTIQLKHTLLHLTDRTAVACYLEHFRELTESAHDPETSREFLQTVASQPKSPMAIPAW